MLLKGQVGPITQLDGQATIARAAKSGELMISEYRARYSELAYRGKVFTAASQAVATSTVGLALTYTGLVVSNPVNSLVNLELIAASVMQSVLQATQVEAFALATGYNATTNVTHTTPLAVKNSLVGTGPAGSALADISATLPTAPFYDTFLTNTATATANAPGAYVELAGQIILPPGGYVCFVTPAQASVAGMWYGLKWAELPV